MRSWFAIVWVSVLVATGCADGDGPPLSLAGDGGAMEDASRGGSDGGGTLPPDGGPTCVPEGSGSTIDPSVLPECPLCDNARCVPNSLVPPEQLDQLADCDESSKCVPDKLVETGGNFAPRTCRSVGGAEGRCLSTCIPQVAEQAAVLPQANCDDGELCAPCFDPLTCESTGACDLSCDMPIEGLPESCTGGGGDGGTGEQCPHTGPDVIDPTTLPECTLCGGGARCVPTSLVPAEQADLLADCDESSKCVPDDFVRTGGNFVPPTCDSVGGLEGRCLSECIPQVAEQIDLLPRDTCGEFERCAPCYDPVTGESTGACEIACDMPTDPPPEPGGECPHTGPDLVDPSTLPSCGSCGGEAHCLSNSLIPDDLEPRLEDCDGTSKCVPDDFIRTGGNFIPETCQAAGLEGRCLSTCLPEIAEQADLLQQGTCGANELCAPCYDPRTGESTGACELACDAPVEDAPSLTCPYSGPDLVDPTTFPTCPMCTEGEAHCLPNDLVPPDQLALLGDCDSTSKCVPDDFIRSTGLSVPDTCRTLADREGRCMSVCIPDIADQSDFLRQETCAGGELCAPCYDPLTGENTGACEVACDAPVEPNNPFQECCDGIGTCVPDYLVPEDQASQLDAEGCTEDTNVLCAPNEFVEDPNYQPEVCQASAFLLGDLGEGRCLPSCLPALSGFEGLLLSQSTCPDNYKCAPCEDPLEGGSTGACDF